MSKYELKIEFESAEEMAEFASKIDPRPPHVCPVPEPSPSEVLASYTALQQSGYSMPQEERVGKCVWTAMEDDYLIANYGKIHNEKIVKHLGRRPGAVTARVQTLRKEGRITIFLRKPRVKRGTITRYSSDGVYRRNT